MATIGAGARIGGAGAAAVRLCCCSRRVKIKCWAIPKWPFWTARSTAVLPLASGRATSIPA